MNCSKVKRKQFSSFLLRPHVSTTSSPPPSSFLFKMLPISGPWAVTPSSLSRPWTQLSLQPSQIFNRMTRFHDLWIHPFLSVFPKNLLACDRVCQNLPVSFSHISGKRRARVSGRLPALPWSWTTRSFTCHSSQKKRAMVRNPTISGCRGTPAGGKPA